MDENEPLLGFGDAGLEIAGDRSSFAGASWKSPMTAEVSPVSSRKSPVTPIVSPVPTPKSPMNLGKSPLTTALA
ncbi:hypothetical protein LG329_05720 [Virgibacillus necropolis]|uniref:hypothetical protein n=1 Tax=Virgibacillus necropolis TaxID=163877 RepID=UPI00384E07A3